jgi:hypothetical protein
MTDAFAARWDEFRNLPNHPEMSVFPDRVPCAGFRTGLESAEEIKCPRCKYSLRGIEPVYCPECGTHVEFEPTTVFTAADQSLVWAAALVLDQHEISNLIVTGSYDPFLGAFAKTGSMPRLMVPLKFVYEAISILDGQFGRRVFKPGEAPPRPAPQPSWRCPACSEDNPATFELCWSCGAPRSRNTS